MSKPGISPRALRAFMIVSIFPVFLSLGGCATTVRDLRYDPGFTFDSIRAYGLHVGGVVSATSELAPADVTSLSQIMWSGFVEERPDIYFFDSTYISSALGLPRRSSMLTEYRNAGFVPPYWLAEIARAIPEARYAVFSRIESDIVTRDRTRETIYSDKEKKNAAGQKIKSEIERRITASLAIYDITTQTFVWGGSVEKSRSDSREYETRLDDKLNILLNTINSAMHSEDRLYPYPPEPSRNDVLRAIFRGFAENFPKAGK